MANLTRPDPIRSNEQPPPESRSWEKVEEDDSLRSASSTGKQTPVSTLSTPPIKAIPIDRSSSSTVDIEGDAPGYNATALQKWLVVFTTSFVTLTACFSSTSLFSVAGEVAAEFDTTANVINASSAGVLLTMGLSNFFWGPMIPLMGRLRTYNTCIVMLLVWTLAASFAGSLPSFIAFRVLSGVQGTFFHVTGQAILAEYFPPVRRGTATGVFLCGTVLGPPLGPLVAGLVTTFTSWRAILWTQSGMVLLGLVLSLIFLQRGGKPATVEKLSITTVAQVYNPAKVFWLMRYPNLTLTDLACGLLAWSQYALLASPHYILVTQYNLTSPLISGLFYLSPAAGFIVGTLFGGYFSDRTVRAWIYHRGGIRLPQDRLRSGFISWFGIVPAASLLFGWSIDRHVPGGLAVPIVSAFFCAAGILAAFAGLNTYCAEVMPRRRQDAIASKYVVQYTFSAIASATTVPLIAAVGVGLQCTICVALVLVAGGLCVVTALYGINMQNWVDRRWPRGKAETPIP